MRGEHHQTPVHAPADRPSRDLIAEFTSQADAARTTRQKYRAHLEEFLLWLNHPRVRGRDDARVEVTHASAGDVHRFMSYLRAGDRFAAPPAAARRAQLSASTRKSFLASLRSFYRYCIEVQLLTIDPSASVRTPKVVVRPGLHLTAGELRELVDAPGGARERIQTFLLVYTAARSGELSRLRWHDIDMHARTLMLSGKGERVRVIDIHPRLMSELRRWLIHQDDQASDNPAIRAAKAHSETDFVLLTRNGKPLAPGTISKQLKRRAARIGLRVGPGGPQVSAVSPHALRRSFATLLLNDGYQLDAVADVLGHASVETTRKHYAFSSSERRRATVHGFNI